MKAFLGFAVVTALLIGVSAWVGIAVIFPELGRDAVDAVVTSAGVAFTVQMLTFGVVRGLAPANMMAGWGAGMLVRFGTLALHGFFGARLLGHPPGAALVSLAAFFFLTTLVEPLFLAKPAPPPRA